jgi:hypothetical protein
MTYKVHEDEHVAGVYRALSLRFLIRYVDMLSSTDSFAGKTIDHGLLPTRRYRRAVDEWVRKPPESAHAALALIEFAGALAADRLSAVLRDTLPSAEMDAADQAVSLTAVAEWLNGRALGERADWQQPAPPDVGGEEPATIAALVEKRFRLEAQTEEAIRGLDLGPDDETGDKIVAVMSDAEGVLDQRIVDRIPETIADLAAQLRLYRILVVGTSQNWADNRDHRLFRSMEEGLDAMMAKDGEAQP